MKTAMKETMEEPACIINIIIKVRTRAGIMYNHIIIYGTMFSQKFLRWWERLGEMVGTLIFLRRGKI